MKPTEILMALVQISSADYLTVPSHAEWPGISAVTQGADHVDRALHSPRWKGNMSRFLTPTDVLPRQPIYPNKRSRSSERSAQCSGARAGSRQPEHEWNFVQTMFKSGKSPNSRLHLLAPLGSLLNSLPLFYPSGSKYEFLIILSTNENCEVWLG